MSKQRTARFQGIVDVPLFQASYNMTGAGTDQLNPFGFIPAFNTAGGHTATQGVLTQARYRALTLNGISDAIRNTGAGLSSVLRFNYSSGYVWATSNWTFTQPYPGDIRQQFWTWQMPVNRNAGVHGLDGLKLIKYSLARGELRTPAHSLWIHPNTSTIPQADGMLWTNSAGSRQDVKLVYFNYASPGWHQCDAFNFGVSVDTLGLDVNTLFGNRAFCNGYQIIGNDFFDTGGGNPFSNYCAWIGGGLAVRLQLAEYETAPFGSARAANVGCTLYYITIDNAVLNTAAQVAFNPSISTNGWFSSWKGGFLLTLFTNGLGPTGKPCEHLVFNRDMTGYYLLRFVGQTPGAQTQINSNAIKSFKIDEEGTIWYRSTSAALPNDFVYFSYSPRLFFNPRLLDIDLAAPVLPCYNTCLPGGQ